MSMFGVVAEYNPLHNGHGYHLSQIKDNESDGVVVVMSGNYVERSETAVISKRYRTQMALSNGADLVIELPLCYATASAEKFAFGAVYLLNALGIVNYLSFGSECGDEQLLSEIADAVVSPEVDDRIVEELKKGISYPSARYNAVKELYCKEFSDLLEQPNNILGIEYIKAIKKLKSAIVPKTVARKGCGHDCETPEDDILSASALRKMISDEHSIDRFVPASTLEIINTAEKAGEYPSDFRKLETTILAFLRQKKSSDFQNIPDVSEGIENRILTAAKTARSLDELYSLAKTKRYTHSRIRRIVLCSYLGITENYYDMLPQYIKVLGFNTKGREMLKTAKSTALLPVVMSASDIKKLSEVAQSLFELECRSTDIFNMTLPRILPCGTEMTDNIVKFE